MTAHNQAKKEEIAKTVIMPGDPLRAKYIAEKYLKDYKLVNTVRNNYAYTGYYNGKLVTVMSSGMGMPSIGIYAYELFKFYDVDKIIRIGTCGSNREDIKILDVLLAESSYTLSTFAELFDNFKEKEISASKELNDKIKETANSMNINIKTGKIITSDVFNPYVDSNEEYFSHYPSNINSIGSEMESFALFFLAHKLNKQAACLLTVVDSPYEDIVVSSFDRQNSLDSMIEVALNSI